VPWFPAPESLPDPRLDRYRNRVAELLRSDQLVGHAMVLTEYVGEAVGGHLWWTRWAPLQEIPSVTIILFDGSRVEASWTHSAGLEAELDHWAHDEMPLLGEL
jgi:hypothetical protein